MKGRSARRRISAPALVLGVALTLQACATAGAAPGTGTPDAGSPGTATPTPEPAESDASLAELEALYEARADSARMRYTEADVRFMQRMIVHHAQALVMAEMAPSHDASPALRTLAARTINAQNDEIDTMRAWLEERGREVPEAAMGDMPEMSDMPGMLSRDQLDELAAARGPEFDRLFLTYMIEHHAGAVTMVEELFATDGAALGDEVFRIASDIQVDQRTEIDRMRSMLDALSDNDALSPSRTQP